MTLTNAAVIAFFSAYLYLGRYDASKCQERQHSSISSSNPDDLRAPYYFPDSGAASMFESLGSRTVSTDGTCALQMAINGDEVSARDLLPITVPYDSNWWRGRT